MVDADQRRFLKARAEEVGSGNRRPQAEHHQTEKTDTDLARGRQELARSIENTALTGCISIRDALFR